MGFITLREYWKGRDVSHAKELTPEIRKAASETVQRANQLLALMNWGPVIVSSGWRPPSINAAAGGSKRSNHLTGHAVDLSDPDGKIDAWCMANLDKLEQVGIWLESPDRTKNWSHWQIKSPASGNRVFNP